MEKDQAIGALLFVACLAGIFVYAYLLYGYAVFVLQITAFIAVALILGILAWIGWTMATTPPPAPIEIEPPPTPAPSTSTTPESPPAEPTAEKQP